MVPSIRSRLFGLSAALICPAAAQMHDPSTPLAHGKNFHVFTTGKGIGIWSSPDLRAWQPAGRVFPVAPAWTTDQVPGHRGHFWAPDAVVVENEVFVYYSVSTFGSQHSSIGLAVSTLPGPGGSWAFRDRGPVLSSRRGDDFNAIDASVLVDADGRWWMAFGSFWKGIHLVELDPATGKRLGNQPPTRLASAPEIEAPFLHRHHGKYLLFVNWGKCCRGLESTYEIRVGRADKITGPYLDREGTPLTEGGGTLVLATSGRRIGPGHAGITTAPEGERLTFHFYDKENRGRPDFGSVSLRWDQEGWPVADAPSR